MTMDISKLWKSYHKKRCVTSRNKLVVHYMPLASKIARAQHAKFPQARFDEIESAAFGGLITAIENYDSQMKTKFETYSDYRIRGAILDWLRATDHQSRSIRTFERKKTNAIAQLRINEESLDEQNVSRAMNMPADNFRSCDTISHQGMNVPLSCLLEDEKFDITDLFADNPSSTIDAKMFEESMLLGLSDRERTVISLYFFKNWTQSQISKKLKVSENLVTKIRREAIYNIRCGLLLKDIRDRLRHAA